MSDENCSSASRWPMVIQLIFFRVSFLLPLMIGSSQMFLYVWKKSLDVILLQHKGSGILWNLQIKPTLPNFGFLFSKELIRPLQPFLR